MLNCQRDLFSIPRETAYLDAAYMSPIPTAAVAAGEAGVRVKAEPWKMTIASYYDEVEQARQLAASMVGAATDDVAIVAATSYGMAIAAANVAVPPGSAILLMENEHTSHRYVWYDLAQRSGALVDIVPQPADGDWTGAIVSAIRTSSRPIAVVAGTLVHWFEGMAIDLEVVAEAARAASAALVVDGTQWVGAVPFDVRRVRPDFLVFATYKFLLGPYRLAFLYGRTLRLRRPAYRNRRDGAHPRLDGRSRFRASSSPQRAGLGRGGKSRPAGCASPASDASYLDPRYRRSALAECGAGTEAR
ncbi:hypothetical protein MesoLj113c_28510 [Mesorhizobium sp. 113-3-9]|nr:hypothetical protein MesoLj113c_28510 [Mesorhizobium sp. 113-3-9]